MAAHITAAQAERYKGTYRAVPRVEWTTLLANEFGNPDWVKLYPINDKGLPVGVLSPRLACKLFHDGLYIIKKGDESPKFIQDRIPEIAHKCYKKKQWRKQFFEGMRRVCCRLASGLGFRPNCIAEDAFIHVILNMAFELGWRRINEFIEPLPETERDKDFTKLTRLANDDIGSLLKGVESAGGKKKAGEGKIDVKADVKGWFKCYETNNDHLFDHIIKIEPEDTENWSIATGDTTSSSGSLQNASGSQIKGGALNPDGSVRVAYRERGNSSLSKISNISTDDAAPGVAAATGDLASLSFNPAAAAGAAAEPSK